MQRVTYQEKWLQGLQSNLYSLKMSYELLTFIKVTFTALSGTLRCLAATLLGSPTNCQGVGTPSFNLKPPVPAFSLGAPFVSSSKEPNQAFSLATSLPSSC